MAKETRSTIDQVLDQNIQALIDLRKTVDRSRTPQDKAIDAIAKFTGSVPFVYIHFGILLLWILWNSRWLALPAFDPFPYRTLPAAASIEAIFLSTLLMINQNRMKGLESKREDLDLQVGLLIEHELTRLARICDLIAQKIGVGGSEVASVIEDVKQDVPPAKVLGRIEAMEKSDAEARRAP